MGQNKVAVLPSTNSDKPESILQRVREALPVKAVFIVYEDMQGHWWSTHSECTSAELCLAGTFIQRQAIDAALGAE